MIYGSIQEIVSAIMHMTWVDIPYINWFFKSCLNLVEVMENQADVKMIADKHLFLEYSMFY